MELQFTEESHKYETVNDSSKKWTSATTIISHFTEVFEQDKIALSCSKKKKSKWYGLLPKKIIELWNKESKRATDLGSWYHDQREQGELSCDTINRDGIDLPVIKSIIRNNIKYSPIQTLIPGIYPEHFVYLKSAMLCGQADRVEIVGDTINIYDYKTNKKLRESYTSWEGITKMLLGPLGHIEDSDLMHYALQLSIYMYIICKHNPTLKPGKLKIYHILFEVEEYDEYDFPITATDPAGEPIVEEVKPYELPYLKNEVVAMINYMKSHPKEFEK